MLSFAEKLTRVPWLISPGDERSLRDAGLNDLEVLHVILGCALFNYLNRVADGIGIRLEYPTTLADVPPPSEAWDSGSHPLARHSPTCSAIHPLARPLRGRPEGAALRGRRQPEGAFGKGLHGRAPAGGLDRIFEGLSANPEAARGAREWRSHHLRGTPRLDEASRLQVGLLAGALSGSTLCARAYRAELARRGEPAASLDALERGEVPAGAGGRTREILDQACRLTSRPWEVREEHLQALRRIGLDDRAILELTTLAAYFSFECRVAVLADPLLADQLAPG